MRFPGMEALRAALAALRLDTRGHKDVLKKRLRTAEKREAEARSAAALQKNRPTSQDFDSYLVLDFEATCQRYEQHHGHFFGYPNEIIEFPVVLLQWRRQKSTMDSTSLLGRGSSPDTDSTASSSSDSLDTSSESDLPQATFVAGEWQLEVIDEFRRFVKPSWRPTLSAFCKELTGISQADVDAAGDFLDVANEFRHGFMVKHDLFTPRNKTVWVTDGPWDLRDFVAKQCYISNVRRPAWLSGPYIDLRSTATAYFTRSDSDTSSTDSEGRHAADKLASLAKRGLAAPNIPAVLEALGLEPFRGRQHSGIDDVRNITRILQELVKPEREWRVIANARISGKESRWPWMNNKGTVQWVHAPGP